MIIDLFFAGDDGIEKMGSIIYDGKSLTATGRTALRLITTPLILGTNKGNAVVDPTKDPKKFMAELPEAYASSRQWATPRLDVPITLG